MAIRPTLTDESFLAYLFRPSKNEKPTGLRKRSLKGSKGHSKARLRSYNRMSAVNQAVIDRSGQRDAYLKGEVSFLNLKGQLRQQAVSKRIAKAPRQRRKSTPTQQPLFKETPLDRLVQAHLQRTLNAEGRPFNQQESDKQIVYMQTDDGHDALTWDYGRIRYAGRAGSEYEVVEDGVRHNPFWYH